MSILPAPQAPFAERRNRGHWFYLSPEGKALAAPPGPRAQKLEEGGRVAAQKNKASPPSRQPAEKRGQIQRKPSSL